MSLRDQVAAKFEISGSLKRTEYHLFWYQQRRIELKAREMERLISPDFAIFSQKQAKSFEPDASLIESSISIECRTENSDAVLKPACQLRFFKRQKH